MTWAACVALGAVVLVLLVALVLHGAARDCGDEHQ